MEHIKDYLPKACPHGDSMILDSEVSLSCAVSICHIGVVCHSHSSLTNNDTESDRSSLHLMFYAGVDGRHKDREASAIRYSGDSQGQNLILL